MPKTKLFKSILDFSTSIFKGFQEQKPKRKTKSTRRPKLSKIFRSAIFTKRQKDLNESSISALKLLWKDCLHLFARF